MSRPGLKQVADLSDGVSYLGKREFSGLIAFLIAVGASEVAAFGEVPLDEKILGLRE